MTATPTRRQLAMLALLAVALLAPAVASAQQPEPRFGMDVSFGMNANARRTAISFWPLRVGGRMRFGLGVRSTLYTGEPTFYENKDATSGNLADSLAIDPVVYTLDATVLSELTVTERFGVGLNFDVLGLAGGPEFISGTLSAKPQSFSYGLGTTAHGAINAEVYAAFRVSTLVRLRGGVSSYVTNYEVTDTAVSGGPTARYQRIEAVPFVAVSLKF